MEIREMSAHQLIVNLDAAQRQGIALPQELIGRADQVIR
jgi:ABC-type uncharacterized transport system substrate-binding protein